MRSAIQAAGTVTAILLASGFWAGMGAQQVTTREVTFHTEFVAAHATLFFPAGFSASGSYAGVVLAPAWGMTAEQIVGHGRRFAERGLVAMAIDYRGWGRSGGVVTLAGEVRTDDRLRRVEMDDVLVRIRRGMTLPSEQIVDVRMAVAYLQGEPGVDPSRIGVWGTGEAGGYVVSVAAADPRVRAGVAQAAPIPGRGQAPTPVVLADELRRDWIRRARTGYGGSWEREDDGALADLESRRAAAEYRPFLELEDVPETFPLLFIVAANESRLNHRDDAYAAVEVLRGPAAVAEVPGVSSEGLYSGPGFDRSANAAAEWFVRHLAP